MQAPGKTLDKLDPTNFMRIQRRSIMLGLKIRRWRLEEIKLLAHSCTTNMQHGQDLLEPRSLQTAEGRFPFSRSTPGACLQGLRVKLSPWTSPAPPCSLLSCLPASRWLPPIPPPTNVMLFSKVRQCGHLSKFLSTWIICCWGNGKWFLLNGPHQLPFSWADPCHHPFPLGQHFSFFSRPPPIHAQV